MTEQLIFHGFADVVEGFEFPLGALIDGSERIVLSQAGFHHEVMEDRAREEMLCLRSGDCVVHSGCLA